MSNGSKTHAMTEENERLTLVQLAVTFNGHSSNLNQENIGNGEKLDIMD